MKADAFRDQVVIVTGASSVIGRALSLQLVGQGATVVLAVRRAELLEQVAATCRQSGLVAVTTTLAWTPLFAMASTVVTDIGGPLSHSSTVAREYGIPAVMATGSATRRIHNGQVITVDCSNGTVTFNA